MARGPGLGPQVGLLAGRRRVPPGMTLRAARQPLPDAMRALALFAVLAVNAGGYLVAPWGALLGERSPPDSGLASAVQGVTAALLQGKGYPMLAFLFGMGLVLATRGRGAIPSAQRGVRRQKRLLKLGLLHGVFIYFGDILTMYALVGWRLLARLHEPWRSLRSRLWRACWWALGVSAVTVAATAFFAAKAGLASLTGSSPEPTLAQAQGWLDFWQINAGAYLALQIPALLLFWPVLRLCMLGGVAAARLRLLTHRRWRPALGRWTMRLALPLLLLNVGYGMAYVHTEAGSQRLFLLEAAGSVVGPPLAWVYVMVLALAARGGQAAWCRWLAPLGQRTLTLYVGHGLLCVALFTGVGIGLQPGTAGMATFSVVLWCPAVVVARASGSRRWPLEAWMARRPQRQG